MLVENKTFSDYLNEVNSSQTAWEMHLNNQWQMELEYQKGLLNFPFLINFDHLLAVKKAEYYYNYYKNENVIINIPTNYQIKLFYHYYSGKFNFLELLNLDQQVYFYNIV